MAAGANKLVPWFSGWACLWPTGQRAASIEARRPTMIGSDFGPAEGHLSTFLMRPRSRGAIGRVRATPGALPTAGRRSDGPDGRVDRIPGTGKGLNKANLYGLSGS